MTICPGKSQRALLQGKDAWLHVEDSLPMLSSVRKQLQGYPGYDAVEDGVVHHEAAASCWPPHCTLHADLMKDSEHAIEQMDPMMNALQQASSALFSSQPAMLSAC